MGASSRRHQGWEKDAVTEGEDLPTA